MDLLSDGVRGTWTPVRRPSLGRAAKSALGKRRRVHGVRGRSGAAKGHRVRPLRLTGDSRRSRRRRPRRSRGRARRGRLRRLGARRRRHRAAQEPRARRLRHQRRAAPGQGRPAGRPAQVAEAIAARLRAADGIAQVDVAGPGFLNITLAAGSLGGLARDIVAAGDAYGRNDALAGRSLNLEFVSANPTGPVHIGAVRWAAVGDALARLLQANGAEVTREYYFNDAGSQIERFARTLREVANGRPVPEDGYNGDYIDDIAKAVVAAQPRRPRRRPTPSSRRSSTATASALMFEEIRASLAGFGVVFDVYFNEREPARQRGAWTPRSSGCAPAATSSRPTARRGCAPPTSATTATAPIVRTQRRVDLLRRRLRVLPQQARARLRPRRAHARRRPPRLHRPAAGDGQLLRRRPGRDARGADRPAGQPGQGRRAGPDEQAGRQRRRAGRPRRRHRRRRRALRPRAVRRRADHRPRPRRLGPAHQRQPGLLRAVRARPARVAAAQRRRPRHRPHGRRRPHAARAPARGRPARRARRVPARGRRRRPSCARRTASRTTSRRWPAPTTASTTPAGCCRWATSRRPRPPTPGCGCARRPASCWPTACACSA